MIKRRHCSFFSILESSVRFIVVLLIWLVIDVGGGLETDDMAAIGSAAASYAGSTITGAVAVLAIILLFQWLVWKNTWVSAENDVLIYESGIFSKRRVSIPFSKINTIDMGRSWFQRIVGTCRLKLDTGAIAGSTDNHSELNLVFGMRDAEMIRTYILSRNAANEDSLRAIGESKLSVQTEPKWVLRARFGDFFMYGLTSSSVWNLFLIFIGAAGVFGNLSRSVIELIGSAVMPFIEWGVDTLLRYNPLLIIVLAIAVMLTFAIVANIWSIVVACVKFYGFRVAREGDTVVVRYGLINLKSYTLPVRNIHAVIVHQNLFQQMIRRCSVEMVSIGYGDEKSENALLFPIIRTSQLEWLVAEVLPEYSLNAELHRTDRRSIRFHILRPLFWWSLLFACSLVGMSFIMDSVALPFAAEILALIFIGINGAMSYKNAGIGYSGNAIVVSCGGNGKTVYYIRTDAVQSVGMNTGVFQRRHGLATYRVDYHAPMLRSIAKVAHLDGGYAEELAEKVDF